MAYDTAVRSYMNSNGYDDSKIGYDPSSGYVTYAGANFLRPQKNYNGTTYSDQDTLTQANQAFRQNNSHLFDTQNNPSTYATSSQSSTPNYTNYGANTGYGQMGQAGQGQINDTINYLMNTARNPQSYDVYSSPQYQAIKAQQDALAQQQYQQDRSGILARGMGDSTYLTDRNARINAQENAKLLGQVVPQLIQEHQQQQQQQFENASNVLGQLMQNNQNQFNQGIQQAGLTGNYNGQQTLAAQNQAFNQGIQQANLTGMYNPYASQEQQMQSNSAAWFNASPDEKARLAAANQQIGALIGAKQDAQGNWIYPQGQRTLAGEQQQASLTGMLPNGNPTYAAQQQAIQNAIARANAFGTVTNPEDAQLLGVPLGTSTRALQAMLNDLSYKQAELGIRSQANQLRAAQIGNEAALNSARANYYNSRISQNGSSTQQKNNLESTYISNIEQMTPENRAAFFKNEKSNIVKDLGASGYNQLYNSYFDQYGIPK